jgi:phenylpropionate dioxygenase-like ring-hydroxylating dioxygenase large terminal subunit
VPSSAQHPEQSAIDFMEMEFNPEDFELDSRRYHSREFKKQEDRAIWFRTWQVACRLDELPKAGDWIEHSIIDQSYVIVRGEDGEVRAFHNACRHRGNQLCHGKGNSTSITCPFHLWQYNLDGSLKHVSDAETFIAFDKRDYGLVPISCGHWGGFVFVNPDANAEPLDDYLAPIREILAPYHLEQMVPTGLNCVQRIECNWKVGIDAFSESYHVQGIHPQNLPISNDIERRHLFLGRHRLFVAPWGSASPRLGDIDPDETVEAFGVLEKVFKGPDAGNSMEDMVAIYRNEDGIIDFPEGVTIRSLSQDGVRASAAATGQDISGLTDGQLVDNYNFLIFPNTTINVRANDMTMFKFMPDPKGDPEVSLFEAVTYQLITDPAEAEARRKPRATISGEQSMGFVIDQDREMMPRQQVGLRSRGLEKLILSRQEIALIHFHQQVDREIAEFGGEQADA